MRIVYFARKGNFAYSRGNAHVHNVDVMRMTLVYAYTKVICI